MDALIEPESDPYNVPPQSLRIIIPFLPPTSNHIYVTNKRNGRRFKSSKAKAFENKFSSEVVPKYLPWISGMDSVESDDALIYDVHISLFFPRDSMVNKGYAKGLAKKRYKRMDTENRLKLLVDCVSSAIAVDDCHFWDIRGTKLIAESFNLEPQVHIFIMKRDPTTLGV